LTLRCLWGHTIQLSWVYSSRVWLSYTCKWASVKPLKDIVQRTGLGNRSLGHCAPLILNGKGSAVPAPRSLTLLRISCVCYIIYRCCKHFRWIWGDHATKSRIFLYNQLGVIIRSSRNTIVAHIICPLSPWHKKSVSQPPARCSLCPALPDPEFLSDTMHRA